MMLVGLNNAFGRENERRKKERKKEKKDGEDLFLNYLF